MSDTVELYFSDLTNAAKARILEAYGLRDASEANWDVFPVATMEIYRQEVENDSESACIHG